MHTFVNTVPVLEGLKLCQRFLILWRFKRFHCTSAPHILKPRTSNGLVSRLPARPQPFVQLNLCWHGDAGFLHSGQISGRCFHLGLPPPPPEQSSISSTDLVQVTESSAPVWLAVCWSTAGMCAWRAEKLWQSFGCYLWCMANVHMAAVFPLQFHLRSPVLSGFTLFSTPLLCHSLTLFVTPQHGACFARLLKDLIAVSTVNWSDKLEPQSSHHFPSDFYCHSVSPTYLVCFVLSVWNTSCILGSG